MSNPETTEAPLDAEGILVTEIHCPKCDYVFSQEGNCDRVELECPSCAAPLCVNCK